MATDRCESCMARIAMNSGDSSASTRARAGVECSCDPLNKTAPLPRRPDIDICPPKSLPGRDDPTWTTDEDAFGGWGASVRNWEDNA